MTVAAPVLVTLVKVSLAAIVRIGGSVTFPMVVMPTGNDPAKVGELVVKVVVDPDTVGSWYPVH